MVTLFNEYVGSDQGQRGRTERSHGGKRLSDRSEHLDDPSQRPIPLIAHVGAS